MSDSIKCEHCGKLIAAIVEDMPMTSLRYRLLDGPLCYGHLTEAERAERKALRETREAGR